MCMGIMVSYMAKPMLPNWAHSRGKAHRMAKPRGISLAKPMGQSKPKGQSHGKTHRMAKAIGVSMAKAMEPKSYF